MKTQAAFNSMRPGRVTGRLGAFLGLMALTVSGLLAPDSRAGVTIHLDMDRNCSGAAPYYLLFPILMTNSPVPADTGYFVWSASSAKDSGTYGDLLPDGTNPEGGGYYADDFPALLSDITNLWTLVVTNLTSTNTYTFRFSSFASNAMPLSAMVFPLEGATNVTNLPTFAWSGPASYDSIGVQVVDNNGPFVQSANLAANQTNWPCPAPLPYGHSFNFSVSYNRDASSSIVSTAPTNGSGQTLSGWASTCGLTDFSGCDFTVFDPFGTNPVPLGVALNSTNLVWQTSGDSNWFGETGVTEDGVAAAQSGILLDNQSSVLQTTVTGPGLVTFWWQTTGQPDNFDLEFDVDGSEQNSLSSQTSWTQASYPVGAGMHTLAWTAFANTGSDPTDAGNVDVVTFRSFAPPAPGAWTATGVMSNAIYLQSTTLLPNGKVLVAGGSDNNNNPTANAELFNPATGAWTNVNALHNARFSHTATMLTNGYLLVAGGVSNYSGAGLVQTVELYNPTNSTWTLTGPMHFPRYGHTATALANGKVLVAGGYGTNLPNPNLTNMYPCELYDPGTGLWTVTGSLLVGRINHTATLLQNGQVLVAGGEVTNVYLVTGECELYDPTSGLWTTTTSMLDLLANHTATLLPNGKVLVAGGDTDIGTFGGFSYFPLRDAEIYDPNAQSWTMTGQLNSQHDFHTATLLTNGLVLEAGTAVEVFTTNSAELYDPVFGIWTTAAQMKFPRNQLTATLLPDGRVLATGGLVAAAELYNSIASPAITISNLVRLGNGAFQFNWANAPGSSNEVLFSTNVATALSNWSNLSGATEISSGHFQFTDSQATNSARRFYRVRTP